MTTDSLRALLAHAIDYAGLFPPASLALEPALRNYADYIRTPDVWMLGAFILPVAEFGAAARGLSQFDGNYRLRISALGPKTDNAETFQASLVAAMELIAAFRSTSGDAAVIDQFEMPLPANVSTDTFKMIRRTMDPQLRTFWEAPAETAERAIKLIADNNRAHAGGKLGFKLRTGGVTANAFPSSAEIAGALMAAGTHQVSIKFTAGLHHPVRSFHRSVQTKMHGFLNVLGAGVLGHEHDWTEKQFAEMLEDEDASSFSFAEDFFAWRDWKVATERVAAHRESVTSLGSCSFDEPREDLRALNLL
ncbi:MAG: hypothetical protein ABR611_03040 [Chthoniobacterales bacterium]